MSAPSDTACIGVVLGSQDATPLEFWVGVGPEAQLELDDVVVVETTSANGSPVKFYGTVDVVRKRYEGAQFDTDAFRAAAGQLPVEVSYAAHVQVTRVEPETFIPPHPGDAVHLVRGAALEEALFFDTMEHRLPIGLTRTGNPVFANLEFLDGTRGAHASISGVSGVATKTSFATFVLYSLFHSQALGDRSTNAKALVFNVKGEDLLWLDKPNNRLNEAARAQYAALGLEAAPFRSVGFFAAPKPGGGVPIPDTGTRQEGVTAYLWSLRDFARQRLLRFVFTAEDERAQLSYVVQRVENALVRWERDDKGDHSYVRSPNGDKLSSLADLADYLDGDGVLEDIVQGGHIATGTLSAFRRRFHSAVGRMGHLVNSADKPEKFRIDWTERQVTVVDIHNLHSTGQMFVVGVVLKQMMEQKERVGTREPLVFLVLDELNKYAPRSGWSPISEVVLDIAERGRSLGVSLFGAQQTASEVERRVIANAALKVVGRLDSAEAKRGEYGFLSGAAKLRATMIRPGMMIVSQPEIPTPLLVQFPFPAWATRADEVLCEKPDVQDLFGGFGGD